MIEIEERFAVKLKYDLKRLKAIVTEHGKFNNELKRIKYHKDKFGSVLFIPEMSENSSFEDFKTIVDLACASRFYYLKLPKINDIGSLRRRANVYSGGNLCIYINELDRHNTPQR